MTGLIAQVSTGLFAGKCAWDDLNSTASKVCHLPLLCHSRKPEKTSYEVLVYSNPQGPLGYSRMGHNTIS